MGNGGRLIAFKMSDVSLKRKLAEIARDSSRVFLTPHATQQMKRRKILVTQVIKCLQRGYVIEPAHQDIKGCWKCTLELVLSGDAIKVAAALDKDATGELVVVITAMRP